MDVLIYPKGGNLYVFSRKPKQTLLSFPYDCLSHPCPSLSLNAAQIFYGEIIKIVKLLTLQGKLQRSERSHRSFLIVQNTVKWCSSVSACYIPGFSLLTELPRMQVIFHRMGRNKGGEYEQRSHLFEVIPGLLQGWALPSCGLYVCSFHDSQTQGQGHLFLRVSCSFVCQFRTLHQILLFQVLTITLILKRLLFYTQ